LRESSLEEERRHHPASARDLEARMSATFRPADPDLRGRPLMWDDVHESLRTDRTPDGWRVTWRGCRAAVSGGTAGPFWRCSSKVLRQHGLCRRHAIMAGLIDPSAQPKYPHGLDNRTRNVIQRAVVGRLTLAEFRRLTREDIESWRNCGRTTIPAVERVRDTWTEDELRRTFSFVGHGWDGDGACNWVGEGAIEP
jgi:hypothetical protein